MSKTTKPKKKETKKFEMTPETLDQILKGELTTNDKAVNYLIQQLIATKNEFEKLKPVIKQKETELDNLRKAINDTVVIFDRLQVDITNLWPK